MRLFELYEAYQYSWTNVSKATGYTQGCIYGWRQRGYIPFKAQLIIEQRLNGRFKADINHGVNNITLYPPRPKRKELELI